MASKVLSKRFLDAAKERNKNLRPLEGYEKKDLVSLEEAVKSLDKSIHNLDAMLQAVRQNAQTASDDLTPDESAAIYLYTMECPQGKKSLYSLLNKRLRSKNREKLEPWFPYLKLLLTALYKLPPVKQAVWRGVCGDVSRQYEEEFIWWGFSSCTTKRSEVEELIGATGERTLFKIDCINGKAIRSHSSSGGEYEIILMPGTYLKVIEKSSPSKNLHIIKLREEHPPHELCKPPFTLPTPIVDAPMETISTASAMSHGQDIPKSDNNQQNTESSTSTARGRTSSATSSSAQSMSHISGITDSPLIRPVTESNQTNPMPLPSGDHTNQPKDTDSQNNGIREVPKPISNSTSSNSHTSNDSTTAKQHTTSRNKKKKAPVSKEKHRPHEAGSDHQWLNLQFHQQHGQKVIKKPNELEAEMQNPPDEDFNAKVLNQIVGSITGMAIGDALGAHVEFRPRQYLVDNPVTDLSSGGTWGLSEGQFTDDTSMALCLANSLIECRDFVPYDQLVRYNWWHQHGYMSSTGSCFDIGAATSRSLREFRRRQTQFAKQHGISMEQIDYLKDEKLLRTFDVYCSEEGVAGNGALMRLAPVPLFFHRNPGIAVEYSGKSGQITHANVKAYDACRYYGALIVATLHGYSKEQILDDQFYHKHQDWFKHKELHRDIRSISQGSYKKPRGYDDGIRGGGYIVKALEAALWAFWSTDNFRSGALAAVNLGDDTDTTAAIYGQLAGAYYGYDHLPEDWRDKVYAKEFLRTVSRWVQYEGERWGSPNVNTKITTYL